MSSKSEKPYVLRAAEFVYTKIIEIKKKNPEINNIQAFEIFITTKEYEILSSGEFHDKWFLDLEKNKFIDPVTKKKINRLVFGYDTNKLRTEELERGFDRNKIFLLRDPAIDKIEISKNKLIKLPNKFKDKTFILSIGRLTGQKNFEFLIKMFSKYKRIFI